MRLESMLGQFLNRASFALRRRVRRLHAHPLFIRLLRFYFRRVVGRARRFWPLFGATAVLSLTYRCQCRCPHCGAGSVRRDPGRELAPGEIRAFIAELGRLGAAGIHFFGGEPLLAAELADYVRRAKAAGLYASVDTNGLALDEKKVLELRAAGLDLVRVSLDSPDAEEHDRLRGVSGTFARAVEAVRLCVRNGLEVQTSLYATRASLADGRLRRLLELSRSLGARARIMSPIRSGRWKDAEVELSPEDIAALRALLDPDWVYWETEFLNAPGVPFWCNSMLRNKFDVTAYGDVIACCYMPVPYGNIREAPLEEIVRRLWSSELVARHREHFDCPMNDAAFLERSARGL